MRIVVTGLIATYPVGGVAWDYVQYVHGLAALGHDVTYLEDTGQWVYSPTSQTFTDDCAANVAHLSTVLRHRDGAYRFAFRDPAGALHGMEEDELRRRCRDAELFLNVSGACWLRDEYRGRGVAAYVDTDPCYSQAKLAAADAGTADEHVQYSAAMIRRHDVFFSFAESIGRPECTIPQAGLAWHPTRHPIVLADWPVTPPPARGVYTTVMSWKIDVTPPIVGGRIYGGKDVEFAKIRDLPGRTPAALEIAMAGAAPIAALRAGGWRVVDARDVSATPEAYQRYLAAARGELSVAKEAYVATRSGWFSTRSASYLASGRPVIVQDTGQSAHYPIGDAILVFTNGDEAAAALADVERDYPRRCAAAREIAATAFDAGTILRRLFADAGL
ncbi:MAG: glycosyltransferase family 1 protein [Deltaproteobacteria bacterium]|nr:glycosyltransferase family 1 protein [Deltaproteobacteria bacterium]